VEPHRRILHVDMDAFYASVEQRDHPALRGRPVAVGGDPKGRGVVCAASYEARTFGVRSAMPMSRAVRLCPNLAIVRPDFAKYHAVSNQVFGIFQSVTTLVEPLSLDEAYLDVTENAWGETLGINVARRLKQEIRAATTLTASAGVAPNKFLAKIASGWQKPDGLTVIAPERVEQFLRKLPVDALWGVGPVTARKLRAAGIARLVDVRTAEVDQLRRAVGGQVEWLRKLASGIDPRPVEPNRMRKSVGSENTFAEDLDDVETIRQEVAAMAQHVAHWLTRSSTTARTVTLKVRYSDFTTITRSHSRDSGTADESEIVERAVALIDRTEAGRRAVRLLGVSVHNLSEPPAGGARRDEWLPFAGPVSGPASPSGPDSSLESGPLASQDVE
jgi:DNA polymerase-4